MSFVASGAVIAAGATIASGYMQSQAAEDAAQTQADAARGAQQVSQNEFNTITQQEQPYMQAGYGALSALNYGLGIGPQSVGAASNGPQGYDPSSGYKIGANGSITQLLSGSPGVSTWQQGAAPISASQSGPTQTAGLEYGSLTRPFNVSDWQQLSPAYNFQLRQGQQGVLNGVASGQGSLSGAAMKDLIDYNQGAASTSFNNAFNQYQTQQGNIFNRLSGIAQLGQTAASNTGQQGTALTGQIGQSITNAGTAAAAGQIGSANAWSGSISSALPWLLAGSNSGVG